MCGRFSLSTPPEIVAKLFDLGVIPRLAPRYNIAPTQSVAVVRATDNSAEPKKSSQHKNQLDFLHWGLIPHWADDPAIGNRMINAKSETAAEKPAFRDAFKKRRCLVPTDGFYEWKRLDANGKVKQPYRIARGDGQVFALAGLWSTWRDPDGKPLESFTILTTEPNAVTKPIHNRMPVIVQPADFAAWLDPQQQDVAMIQSLIRPTPDGELTAIAVSRHVNSPKNDDAGCLEPSDTTSRDGGPPIAERADGGPTKRTKRSGKSQTKQQDAGGSLFD